MNFNVRAKLQKNSIHSIVITPKTKFICCHCQHKTFLPLGRREKRFFSWHLSKKENPSDKKCVYPNSGRGTMVE